MRISELAKRANCQVETIRYYEQQGLLPEPARTGGNYRDYHESHVEQLTFIRRCRSLDMSLSEIRALLQFRLTSEEDCEQVNQILDEHIGHVSERIAELQRLKTELKTIREKCSGKDSAKRCSILSELASEEHLPHETENTGSSHLHKTHGKRGVFK